MTLPGEGRPSSACWIVGRDWGETEQRTGLPFQGAAGNVLNRALTGAGLRREDCLITNVVNAHPAGNKWELHAPETVARHNAALQAALAAHKPKLVIALGNEALRACVQGDPEASDMPGIEEARGYLWERFWTGGSRSLVLGIVHPAAALRQWVPWRVLIDVDFKKAAAELRLGCPALPQREVRVVTCAEEASLAAEGLLRAKRLAVDIENTRDLRLACCGFAASADVAWVFPARHNAAIQALCESDVPKVLQNGAYDRYFLARQYGIELRNQTFDTLLAWHVAQPELAGQAVNKKATKRSEKSLRFLASIYTREPFWKEYSFQSEDDRYRLNGLDCCITFEVAQKLEAELEKVCEV